jgi:2-hydroxychromene-2-carboxylate isomerase
MPRTIDYYFTIASPWTYLGHGLLQRIAARHGAVIRHKPMPIMDVFEATGSLPLPKRPPARQRYRFVEMQRWREKRGLPLTLKPAHFPLDATMINKVIIAAADLGHDPAGLTGQALAAVWAEDADLNQDDTITSLVAAADLPVAEVLTHAKSARTSEILEKNGQQAITADVFGAPGYVLDGEVFWGQDRLELLDDALASGRVPYRPV